MSAAKYTPGPWRMDVLMNVMAADGLVAFPGVSAGFDQEANARLIAAAPELLAACENARDMIATDRQSFVDCQRLRDGRAENPIAHGLVAVGDGAWITPEDAEALLDYERAISLIDAAVTKATGESA